MFACLNFDNGYKDKIILISYLVTVTLKRATALNEGQPSLKELNMK